MSLYCYGAQLSLCTDESKTSLNWEILSKASEYLKGDSTFKIHWSVRLVKNFPSCQALYPALSMGPNLSSTKQFRGRTAAELKYEGLHLI